MERGDSSFGLHVSIVQCPLLTCDGTCPCSRAVYSVVFVLLWDVVLLLLRELPSPCCCYGMLALRSAVYAMSFLHSIPPLLWVLRNMRIYSVYTHHGACSMPVDMPSCAHFLLYLPFPSSIFHSMLHFHSRPLHGLGQRLLTSLLILPSIHAYSHRSSR